MSDKMYPCEFCDTDQAQVKKLVTLTRQRCGQWYIFQDVLAWVCLHCGHRYFDADVLETMKKRMTSTPTHDMPL